MKKKTLIITLSIAVIAVMALGLTSCSKDSDTLKAVTSAGFAPFEYHEDGNDEIIGFDVDLLNAIADDQGFKVEFTDMEFDSLLPALDSGNGDIVIAGMNKLAGDRAEKADFSDAYFESDLMLLVSTDSTITGIDAVTSDMKIASQIATTGAEYAQKLEEEGKIASAVVLNQWADCYQQLKNGDVQGVIVDKPVAETYLAEHSDIAKIVGGTFGDHEEYGIAVKKGNSELLEKINTGLANLKKNGKYDELVSKWFN